MMKVLVFVGMICLVLGNCNSRNGFTVDVFYGFWKLSTNCNSNSEELFDIDNKVFFANTDNLANFPKEMNENYWVNAFADEHWYVKVEDREVYLTFDASHQIIDGEWHVIETIFDKAQKGGGKMLDSFMVENENGRCLLFTRNYEGLGI